MPYEEKKNADGSYELVDAKGRVYAKKTTKKKAQKQIQAIEANKRRRHRFGRG